MQPRPHSTSPGYSSARRLAFGRVARLLLFSLLPWTVGATAEPAPIVRSGETDYVIVVGENGVYDQFAAAEFTGIMRKSTGASFKIVSAGDPEAASPKKRVFIGDSRLTRRLLGEKTVSGLKNQESLVTYRGSDIFIVGGGRHGTPYGVYLFLEKELGYRCFTPLPGGERIPKHENLTASGKELRERPAFDLLRLAYMMFLYDKNGPKYQYRNRGDVRYKCVSGEVTLDGIANSDFPLLDTGHGFNLYITTDRTKSYYKWDESKDYFQTSPDFFSLDRNGKRTKRGQLCFSNPQLRQELTKRIIERGKRRGGRGILTIGANDWPGSFCHCEKCRKLEEKYGCTGGPLYDYILEACPKVAKALPDIRISTLAYRKAQSEYPPKNVDRMPDNWICDFAPVDDDQGQALDGERNQGTLKNLRDWSRLTSHITYWYYICINSAPFGPVERLSRDMKLMHESGVRGVGVCGLGSPGMYPMQEYLLFRLMIDPYQDVWALVAEYNEHHYGEVQSEMTRYVRELDEVWREPKTFVGLDSPGKEILSFTPARLIRWQKMFDSLEKRLSGKSHELRNLSRARWDVDMLTLSHYRRILETFPDCGIAPEQVIERMREVDLPKRWNHYKLRKRAETAYLTCKAMSKPLPSPLDKLPDGQVTQLPQCGGIHSVKDADAACGEAKTQPFRDDQMEKRGKKIGFDIYDKATKRTLKHGEIDASKCAPGKYELYLVTKTIIARGGLIAFDSWWGIQDSLAPYYPAGDEFREFEIWASLKFVGPSFGIETEDRKDRMFCDRIFLVDRNVGSQKRGNAPQTNPDGWPGADNE